MNDDNDEFFRRLDEEALAEAEAERQKARAAGAKSKPGHSAGYRFDLLDASVLKLNKKGVYLVKNIIPAQGLIVVWGPPKCGKSFWILDVLFHIALGWEYRGRRVKAGLVVYIGCEGEFAVPARVEAFRQDKIKGPIDPECFKLILTRLDLVVDIEKLVADIREQLGDCNPAIITIDTLNRSLKGSESSDEDMGNYVKAADRLRAEFQCAVAIIHHCGINDSRPRGHTSLAGAADAQIAVKKDASGLITTTVEWMKDGPEGEETASKFKVIEYLDFDEDGESIASCVLEQVEHTAAAPKVKPQRMTAGNRIALNALIKALDKGGKAAPASNDIPAGARVVEIDLWRGCYYAAVPAEDATAKKSRATAFRRAVESLQGDMPPVIGSWNDLVWIIRKDENS
jgi:hypothetical protein